MLHVGLKIQMVKNIPHPNYKRNVYLIRPFELLQKTIFVTFITQGLSSNIALCFGIFQAIIL